MSFMPLFWLSLRRLSGLGWGMISCFESTGFVPTNRATSALGTSNRLTGTGPPNKRKRATENPGESMVKHV
jgi:hypothetical protein